MVVELNPKEFYNTAPGVRKGITSPDDPFWGTAVKEANSGVYPKGARYKQRKIIKKRLYDMDTYERPLIDRSTPDEKNRYAMYFGVLAIVALILLYIIHCNEQK